MFSCQKHPNNRKHHVKSHCSVKSFTFCVTTCSVLHEFLKGFLFHRILCDFRNPPCSHTSMWMPSCSFNPYLGTNAVRQKPQENIALKETKILLGLEKGMLVERLKEANSSYLESSFVSVQCSSDGKVMTPLILAYGLVHSLCSWLVR